MRNTISSSEAFNYFQPKALNKTNISFNKKPFPINEMDRAFNEKVIFTNKMPLSCNETFDSYN